ncbi:ComEC/Rec2 family competence protein [Phaeodactylibacter luteus]|nr:ComEC/Rec2 family competence protein [Phaeodactylibacter luteus]
MNWREIPMLRLLLALLAGIGLSRWDINVYAVAGAGALSLAALAWMNTRKTPFHQRIWPGVAVIASFSALGFLLAIAQQPKYQPSHLLHYGSAAQSATVVGRIQRIEDTGRKLRLQLQCQGVQPQTDTLLRQAEGGILAYLDIDAASRGLRPGDLLLFQTELRRPNPPANPDQFDYRAYLEGQGIYHQAFIGEGQWLWLGHQKTLLTLTAQWQDMALSTLRHHLPTPNEMAVGAALILGHKAALTDEVKNAYADTGAMHVLAVSGLHVGLVQLLLFFLLKRIPLSGRKWEITRTGLVIAGIWAFALITGASPSVLRAATMFSFLAVGQASRRSSSVYNTLAASAFVLLCANPNLISQVGFQLSYLAVLGIVYFQPRIYRLWLIKNRAGDYLWQLTAVALAAQLGTLPLSLYYFHQFPVYFILSGIIVVIAAGFILGGGLLLLLVQSIPLLGTGVGKMLYGLIWLANSGVFLVQGLPGGLMGGIHLSAAGAALLYLALLLGIAAARSRRAHWAMAALVALLLASALRAHRLYEASGQEALVVYQIYRHSAMDYFRGAEAWPIYDSQLELSKLGFAVEGHRLARSAEPMGSFLPAQGADVPPFVWGQDGFWFFNGLRLLLCSPETLPSSQAGPMPATDLVLLSHNPKVDLRELINQCKPRYIIADGSNPPWAAREWAAAAKKAQVPFLYTSESGAATITWQPELLVEAHFNTPEI